MLFTFREFKFDGCGLNIILYFVVESKIYKILSKFLYKVKSLNAKKFVGAIIIAFLFFFLYNF